jgi:hypothetical protein
MAPVKAVLCPRANGLSGAGFQRELPFHACNKELLPMRHLIRAPRALTLGEHIAVEVALTKHCGSHTKRLKELHHGASAEEISDAQ